MSIKTTLKKIKWISTLYNRYKIHKMNNLCKDKYIFEGKEKGSDKLCYILAGYKPFLWDIVFKRIKEFVPQDYDLCIVSSGLYNETLSKIAKENGWCYLSTKTNNVALVQNVVISKFAEALYLFKLDEDIFVTKNYFGNLLNLYKHLKNESTYDVGVVSPLIPINGFAHALVLDRYGLVRDYESKFEKILQKADPNRMIENNPDVAKYMWGCGNGLPNIDRMACDLSDDNASYVPAPVKFSIGAILFDRRLWKDMGYFKFKSKKDNCMGGGRRTDLFGVCFARAPVCGVKKHNCWSSFFRKAKRGHEGVLFVKQKCFRYTLQRFMKIRSCACVSTTLLCYRHRLKDFDLLLKGNKLEYASCF